MAKEEAGATEQQAQKPKFGIERIYLKDVSLECPKGVEAFSKPWSPRVDMDLNNVQNKLSDELYEVVLRLTLTVKDGDSEESVYLIEIEQAGTFHLKDVPELEIRRILATVAPSALFPYARETIDSLVTKANFPPLRLAPVNFEALYARAVQQQKEAQENSTDDTVQ